MVSAFLTTFLAAIFVWHAWHHDIELMPRMPRWVVAVETLLPWLICLPAWRHGSQSGWRYAIIATLGAAIASGAVLALDRRYARMEQRPRKDDHGHAAG